MRPFPVTRLRAFTPPLFPFFDPILLPFNFSSSSSSSCFSTTLLARNWDPAVSLALNHPTLLLLEKSCRTSRQFKQILAQMMRLHLTAQTFSISRLLYFAAVSLPEHLLGYALLLFQHFTPNPNLFIFNTMISALSFSLIRSVSLYKLMLSFQVFPDEHSLIPLLKPCECFSLAKQIHAHIIVNGFGCHVYLQNSLISAYMACENQDSACQVFASMPLRDVVSFNIMISRYARKGLSLEAFELFRRMIRSGTRFDEYTVAGLLQSCGQLKDEILGKSVHGLVIRRMLLSESLLVLCNAIIDMYVKCENMMIASRVFEGLEKKDGITWNTIVSGFANAGEMDIACQYFSNSPVRDLVSWNSLLGGFARKGDWRAVMNLFAKMLACNDVHPDEITSATLISAASVTGSLHQGLCVHGWVVRAHGNSDPFLGSALIDMYSKCGSFERSLRVFTLIEEKDIAAWTAMIASLAFHGHGARALDLFEKLQERGLRPNSVTLIAVLTACSHSGLVDQGLNVFYNMKQEYGVEPGIEHYGCVVDLLARSGKLAEARDVIERMLMKPSQSMWGAILSGSRAHGDMKLAAEALEKLEKLDPEDDGAYISLANVYALCGRWSCSGTIRDVMGGRGIKKTAGWSGVVIDGVLHAFVSSDKKQPNWGEIHNVVCWLHKEMALLTETL